MPDIKFVKARGQLHLVELNGQQVMPGAYPAIQRNAAVTCDFKCLIPKPIVIVVHINGRPAWALIDSALEKPLTIQLAVQGSWSKVNFGTKVRFEYQQVNEEHFFNIINLQNYDLVLGTPFLFQHKAMIGLNHSHVVLGSDDALPIKGEQVSVLESRMAETYAESLESAHQELYRLARPLCAKASETELPPLWAINHTIPLIDPDKIYKWQPS
ncbi:hypothetical protein K503DRAFT_794673 [Rhizopogon vinicolor AM-OR11-026]|uniref:Uncharacterized protein n=1 Tax=Rhizopogon vinicolor AM-OR11-026 TaxID=1314800 RepID=A0A1B7MJL0_9AGAM|nr:hypothetical protein K503DRAFT_794673 [Rhizopogon vinicolor AM-OR11-026]